ncbi:CerR family C-terminal domain-containing protein [Sphingomonas sp.]|uniref:CerR family C-terminal domain-containing protein n=1 Tax=Sphingomonas sp. TaxID=28214 RepID=UPI0025D0580D|nr:CerR family C-terminal domain-containing protein [Sphingomonas sp.]
MLIDIAIEQFGVKGLDGTSTRAIAAGAGTVISSITYHFGGKEGLYLAAADRVASGVAQMIASLVEDGMKAEADGCGVPTARASLHNMFQAITEVFTRQDAEAYTRFLIREQAEPTEAFQRIYRGAMAGILTRIAHLIQVVSNGKLDTKAARLQALMLVGQVIIFRAARATVVTTTGWTDIGINEKVLVQSMIVDNLDTILDHLEHVNGLT